MFYTNITNIASFFEPSEIRTPDLMLGSINVDIELFTTQIVHNMDTKLLRFHTLR